MRTLLKKVAPQDVTLAQLNKCQEIHGFTQNVSQTNHILGVSF